MSWIRIVANDEFKFDPNSTENEGRWRIRDPKDFDPETYRRWKKWAGVEAPAGVTFLVGNLLDSGKKAIQTIRFDKKRINEKQAEEFWETLKDKPGFHRIWSWNKTASFNIISRIVKRKDGYHVVSEKNKNLGGPYKTREGAKKRLQQVEMFKHMKASIDRDKIHTETGSPKEVDLLYWLHQILTTNPEVLEFVESNGGNKEFLKSIHVAIDKDEDVDAHVKYIDKEPWIFINPKVFSTRIWDKLKGTVYHELEHLLEQTSLHGKKEFDVSQRKKYQEDPTEFSADIASTRKMLADGISEDKIMEQLYGSKARKEQILELAKESSGGTVFSSWIKIRADVKSKIKQLLPLYEAIGVSSKEDAIKRIDQCSEADPTGINKANYIKWIVIQDTKGNYKYPEDKEKYLEVLKTFEKVKNSKKVEKKDINQYATFDELYKVMEKFLSGEEATSSAEEKRMLVQKGQSVMFQEGPFKVIKITTPEAATEYTRNTELCIKDPKFSKEYLAKGPLFLILKDEKVYAVAEDVGEEEDVKDVHDVFINEEMFAELKPVLNRLGIFLDYMSDAYTIEDGKYFLQNPKAAYFFAKSVLKKRWPEAEEMILKDSFWGHKYKEEVMDKAEELAKVSNWTKKQAPMSDCCCRKK